MARPSNQSYSSQPAAPQQYSQNEPPPPPPDQAGYDQSGYDQAGGYAAGDYDDTADQQEVYAPEPPPPMPEYEQPYCPGDDYIWTPGYWFWSPAGYYWVPGAWVLAPYVGALWTPGYWGFAGGRYGWHYGYWGPYIGFYGGINYGYGYFGNGYQGGYWNRGAFYYNRSITRVNNNIRYVYTRNVSYNNRTRVSYNGGHGGLNVRPNQSQLNAAKARRFGAIPAQRQLVSQAQGNRSQFAKTNNGRPAEVAYTSPGQRRSQSPRGTTAGFSSGCRHTTGNRARVQRPAENRPTAHALLNSTRPAPSTGHPTNGKPTPERPATRPTQPRPETRPAQPRPETRLQRNLDRNTRPDQTARSRGQKPGRTEACATRPESRPAPKAGIAARRNLVRNRGLHQTPQPRPEPRPAPQPRPKADLRNPVRNQDLRHNPRNLAQNRGLHHKSSHVRGLIGTNCSPRCSCCIRTIREWCGRRCGLARRPSPDACWRSRASPSRISGSVDPWSRPVGRGWLLDPEC